MKQFLTWTVRCLSVLFLGLAIVYTITRQSVHLMAGLPVFILIAVVFYLLLRRRHFKLPVKSERTYNILTMIMFCISAAVVVLCGSQLAVNHSWDWGRILGEAMNYADHDSLTDVIYYAQYPNNQFMYRVLVYAFRFIRLIIPDFPTVGLNVFAILLSCAMVLVGYLFIYLTVKEMYGSRAMFFCSIAVLLYTPSYLYATFAYTDTFSLPFNAAILYLYARKIKIDVNDPKGKRKTFVLLALIGIIGGIGARFKIFTLVYLIALLVTEFAFSKAGSRLLSLLISASILLCTAVPAYLFPDNTDIFDIDQAVYDRYRFPLEHWVMMGLKSPGGFNAEDVNYTAGFESYNEKKDADRLVIRQRIQEKGISGMIQHVFYTKLSRVWAQPALAANDYVSRNSLHEDGLLRNIFGLRGKYHAYYLAYQSVIHLLLLVFLFLVALLRVKKPFYFLSTTTLLGMFLFLSIWECNSRYLYSLIPCFLINSLEGTRILSHWLVRHSS